MAFPNIHPVSIGRDGWSVFYDTPVKRLLFHCGLRLTDGDPFGSHWRLKL